MNHGLAPLPGRWNGIYIAPSGYITLLIMVKPDVIPDDCEWRISMATNTINPTKILTEEELNNLLSELGYKTRSVPFGEKRIFREHAGVFKDEPRRYIVAQDNEIESHAVIIVENEALYIYWYNPYDDVYEVWEKLSGDLERSRIKEVIRSATTIADIKKRFPWTASP